MGQNNRIDILSQIKKMRELHKHCRFTHYEQLLFYELLALSDYQDDNTTVFCSNEDMCSILNVDITTLRRARNRLSKACLITYNSGRSKRQVGQYILTNPTPDTLPNPTPLFPASDMGLNEVPLSKKVRKPFTVPPSFGEVQAYCLERNNGIDPQLFIDHYQANGWMVGKNKMKDWKACIRTWEQYRKRNENKSDNSKPKDYTKGF